MPTGTENITRSALRRRLEALDDKTVARLNEISRPVNLPAGRQIIIEGIIAIQAGDQPQLVEEKLKSFLSPTDRKVVEGAEANA